MAMTPPMSSTQRNDPCDFSIRDLLWATLVVAMGLGWWVHYQAVDAKRLEAVGSARVSCGTG